MKCKQTQQRLLATSGPHKLSNEVQAHLEHCSRCRQWHARLDEIDRNIPHVPVPASAEAKAALIEQILTPEPAAPSSVWKPRVPRSKWERVLVGLAAAALLTLGVAVYRGARTDQSGRIPNDPLLAGLLHHNLAMAKDASPKNTMLSLAALAHDLDGETRNLARVARAEDLNALADLYDEVVRKGILKRADELPPDERKVLDDIANELFTTSGAATQLAKDVPLGAAGPLKKIADAARDGNTALRKLKDEKKIAHDHPPSAREGRS